MNNICAYKFIIFVRSMNFYYANTRKTFRRTHTLTHTHIPVIAPPLSLFR